MPRTAAVASDNFDRGSYPVAPGSNWAHLRVGWGSQYIVSPGYIRGSSAEVDANKQAMRWVGSGTFNADQWSEIEIQGLAWQSVNWSVGVIVRASGDTDATRDYYYAYVAYNSAGPTYNTRYGKIVNGTITQFHDAAVAWANGDRIGLEIEGTELRVTKNGTALGGSFTTTDSDLSSGQPGCMGSSDNDTTALGNNWEAGNFTSGSAAIAAFAAHSNPQLL